MSLKTLSSVTGAPILGLTLPTYTLTEDVAPDVNGLQFAVTALGGTQTGVTAHSVSDPFTLSFFKPKNPRIQGNPDSAGVYRNNPKNVYKCRVRKGVNIGNEKKEIDLLSFDFNTPAGADSLDAVSLKAALSLAFGALYDNADDVADLITQGLL